MSKSTHSPSLEFLSEILFPDIHPNQSPLTSPNGPSRTNYTSSGLGVASPWTPSSILKTPTWNSITSPDGLV
eukprot:25175_5